MEVIDEVFEEFSIAHSEFVEPLPDCILLDDANLIGFITSFDDILMLVEMWHEERYSENFTKVGPIYMTSSNIFLAF